jgi:hypothetical protein
VNALARWQNGYVADCKSVYAGSIPARASIYGFHEISYFLEKFILPNRYWAYDRWWIILGSLAFPAVTIIFWLMVVKPA